MRINRSLSTIVRRVAAATLKKTILTTGSLALVLGAAFVTQNFLTNANLVYAVTTPDSCFAFDAGTNTITDYYDNEGNNSANPACPRAVDIPSTIGGVAVTKIGNAGYPGAFTSKDLTSVTIPSSVTSIGDYAFYDNQLTTVTIPNSVTSIGGCAFCDNQLTTITIPNSVTSIDTYAFSYNQLTTATFLGSVTIFGSDIFKGNPITSITYAGTTYIPTTPVPEQCYAFDAGTITKYNLYDMNVVKNSGIGCLSHTVDIPSTIGGVAVTSIGNLAFDNSQLASITIPSSMTSIGNNAFSSNQLTYVTIPSSVTIIGNNAFQGNQLTTATFLGSVTIFGSHIFDNNSITSLTYAGTIHTPTTPVPEQCYAFDTGTITNYKYADMNVIKNSGIGCLSREIDIPSTIAGVAVTSIGTGAFNYNQLSSVTIPDSVTSIGDAAFEANNLTALTIPTGITTIGKEAFAINKLTSVTIPNNITSIDPSAFFGQNPWGGVVDWGIDPAHDWYSDDQAVRQLVFDNIWYTRLYTEDPTNPNGLKDGITNEDWYTGDINNNGDSQDSLGGHLINPTAVSIRYQNLSGVELAPTQTLTGRLADTTDLSDYLVKNVSVPAMTNSAAPTLQEQTALDQALSVYHRAGTHVSLTAPTIAGYQAPTPASPYAKTLVAGDNIVDFTYHPYTTNIDFSQNPTSPYGTTIAPVPTNLDVAIASSDLKIDDTKPCTHIAEASLLPASGLTAPDATYDILGGIDFTLTCTADGAAAAVTYTLGSQFDTATVKVYKYNATTKTATDITSQVTLTNVNGKTVVAYSVTDGAANDEDATVNKQVVDPIYLAVARSVIAPVDILTPTATLPLAATGNSGLAETGRNVIVAVVGTFAVIIFGLLGIVRSRFVKQ